MTGSKALSLLSLPDELFLQILEGLPLTEKINVLPFVCKSFSRLQQIPQLFFGSLRGRMEFTVFLEKKGRIVDGDALCKWLRPRVRQLLRFDLPLTLPLQQADRLFVPHLFDILPPSLTYLRLQSLRTDTLDQAGAASAQTSLHAAGPALGSFPDPIPHLHILARLSALQHLVIPTQQALDKCAMESLALLPALQHLRLQHQDRGNPPRHSYLQAGANLSILVPLTSLSLAGGTVDCVEGGGTLPDLRELHIATSTSLVLSGILQSTSLVSLSLSKVTVDEPGPVLSAIFQSLINLEELTLDDVQQAHLMDPLEIGSVLEHVNMTLLSLSGGVALAYGRQPKLTGHTSPMTFLSFDGLCCAEESGFPGLSQLTNLVELLISVHEPRITARIPSNLQFLCFLKQLWIIKGSDRTAQEMDMSALALLGSAIESVRVLGSFQVMVTRSLLPLAAQPNLKAFRLNVTCNISSAGNSWLHWAAFFHALLDRPQKGLPAVSLWPDLTRF